jgi:hypothetical protein
MDTPNAATQVAAPLTIAQAGARLAEKRQAQAQSEANPVTEAARTLGKAAAEARKARTEAQPEPQAETEEVAQTEPVEEVSETIEAEDNAAHDGAPEAAETVDEPEQPSSVKLSDGTEVTLDEVEKGFLRQADYTRKTMELAEKRKAVEAEVTGKLTQLEQALVTAKALTGTEPDWQRLANEQGGEEAFKQKLAWDNRQGLIQQYEQGITAEREKMLNQARQDRDRVLAESYNSKWLDPKAQEADYGKIVEWAKNEGFADNELIGAVSPHHLKTLHKAMLWDELQKGKHTVKQAVANKPKVIRPGVKADQQSNKFTAVSKLRVQAQKSGSVADAVALMRAKRNAAA